ncbi:Flagellar hook-associated protein FlgL [Pseudomonas cannabina pv. alisalensis]|uniref:Flagellar hook-associated protein FlgL n=2 Tax=Pseudomonas cannabina TaxID=86840 RepID=A0A3M3R299_PSECA|nr:flagellar hook-associated protein 3 [Pseudomonas cannabina]KPW20671.1 Flagellar hook-associated protein FlgL [Pseudomonas cannabina pv. alisalensis]MBM0140839.1 flagellar hook-associated protein 3 [Pseudomonas cannabina pv. alisalensis]RMN85936.1 Flagellar hook-associated protein FlgL [Pseudomonas cannabina]RMN85976.1 Flagellar hook-associated protein FlgL [Pseudomonas cannabina pv. alisalensis]RMN90395.1 Flagellar hook-associated protein FlgL [Pseudomonas cannabina]
MRISTTQFYEATNTNYQRNYANLNKTSEEVSSGIKLNTASDDPVGASRVLQLAQQNSMLTQYAANIGTINTNVVSTETALTSIIDTMQSAREEIISASNGVNTDSERLTKAESLKQYQGQLLALMNSKDANGQYILAGSKSSTPPYSLNADGFYSYKGDQTSVNLAVGDGLVMASNTTGYEAFEQSVNSTRTSATLISPATDDGKIGLSAGQVTSTPTYNSSYQAGEPYTLTFLSGTQFKITDSTGTDVSSDASSAGKFGNSTFEAQTFTFRGVEMTLNVNLPAADRVSEATADAALTNRSYQLSSTPDSVSTSRSAGNTSTANVSSSTVGNTAADRTAFNNTFPTGGAILKFTSATDYDLFASPLTSSSKPVSSGTMSGSTANASGVNFNFSGTPAAGDQFIVESGTHQNENILNTLTAAIKALSTPVDGDLVATQKMKASLDSALGNITSGIAQASTARANGGARQLAASAQGTTNELLKANNTIEQGTYVNADIVEATTRLTLQKTMLDASQQVFTLLSKLNLFSQL